MRLDKYLANSGIGSRSEVKKLIKQKRVTVNDLIIKSDAFDVDENKDIIKFDGELVRYKECYYFLLNKPQGYVSAREDNVYPCITELIKGFEFVDLFPVGRLDLDTTGAILLTNDGDLCHKLITPKYHVDKCYEVEVDKKLDKKLINEFKNGVLLDDELTLPGELNIIDNYHAELTIHQGKFHQVKRMFKKFGYEVIELNRKSFAFLDCTGLNQGDFRELTLEEENELKHLVIK